MDQNHQPLEIMFLAQLLQLDFLFIKDLSSPCLYIRSRDWPINKLPLSPIVNFKLPIFVDREDNNLRMWNEKAANKIHHIIFQNIGCVTKVTF